MSLHADLIEQAKHLARREKTRPKQASLRRAVSAAYYALFHFLVDRATRQTLGTDPAKRRLRYIVARGFNHGTMKTVSEQFSKGKLPKRLDRSVSGLVLPNDLMSIVASFVRLQQERHRADYDLADDFSRDEVMRLIDDAESAIELWYHVRHEDAAKLYLAALAVWDRVVR